MGATQSLLPTEKKWNVIVSSWEPSAQELPHYTAMLAVLQATPSVKTFVESVCGVPPEAWISIKHYAVKGDATKNYSMGELHRFIRLCALGQLELATSPLGFAQMALTILPHHPTLAGKALAASATEPPLADYFRPAPLQPAAAAAAPGALGDVPMPRAPLPAPAAARNAQPLRPLLPDPRGMALVNYLHLPAFERLHRELAAGAGGVVAAKAAFAAVAQKIFAGVMTEDTFSSLCAALGRDPQKLSPAEPLDLCAFASLFSIAALHTQSFDVATLGSGRLGLLQVTEAALARAREVAKLPPFGGAAPIPSAALQPSFSLRNLLRGASSASLLPTVVSASINRSGEPSDRGGATLSTLSPLRAPPSHLDFDLSPQYSADSQGGGGGAASASSTLFSISNAERRHFNRTFEDLYSLDLGKVAQEDFAHHFVAQAGLPIDIVRFVFHLSDIDNDGLLDDAEYLVAHHLLFCWMQGITVPHVLYSDMVPRSKRELLLTRELPFRSVKRVFISYRWQSPNAKGMAILLQDTLTQQLKYDFVFLDVLHLTGKVVRAQGGGGWLLRRPSLARTSLGSHCTPLHPHALRRLQNESVKEMIASCHAVVPIWTAGAWRARAPCAQNEPPPLLQRLTHTPFPPFPTAGCYDRCIDESDAVRIEVETALALDKHIVPFIDTTYKSSFFDSCYKCWPAAGADTPSLLGVPQKLVPGTPPPPASNFMLPSTMNILGRTGVVYVHEYPDLWIRKIHRLLQQW